MAEETCSDQMADFTDSQLAAMMDSNPSAFAELTVRYLSLIRAKAAHFQGAMLEADDLCQEGLMGLLNAARTYDPSAGASFKTYAGICISNRMIVACRTAANRKNIPLRNFVSLNDEEAAPGLSDKTTDPETVLIDSENLKLMWQHMRNTLTRLEQRVLLFYLAGRSYSEIAAKLGISSKAVDNALQRVRLKLKKFF